MYSLCTFAVLLLSFCGLWCVGVRLRSVASQAHGWLKLIFLVARSSGACAQRRNLCSLGPVTVCPKIHYLVVLRLWHGCNHRCQHRSPRTFREDLACICVRGMHPNRLIVRKLADECLRFRCLQPSVILHQSPWVWARACVCVCECVTRLYDEGAVRMLVRVRAMWRSCMCCIGVIDLPTVSLIFCVCWLHLFHVHLGTHLVCIYTW